MKINRVILKTGNIKVTYFLPTQKLVKDIKVQAVLPMVLFSMYAD